MSSRYALRRALPMALLGVGGAWLTAGTAWADAPAPAWLAAAGTALSIGFALSRDGSGPLVPWLVAWIAGVLASAAVGSSLASSTWVPVFAAAFLAGRASGLFVTTLLTVVLLRDAPTLVVLVQQHAQASMSGSVQYYLGFAGVMAAPLFIAVACMARSRLAPRIPTSLVSLVGSLLAALAVWSVLASGSRAALLGLVGALLVAVVTIAHAARSTPGAIRSVVALAVFLPVAVIALDLSLSAAFGFGGSTMMPQVTARVEATVGEMVTAGPSSTRTRLELWRQAATMVGDRPVGFGPGSYGHVNHAYQTAPMLWSGSPHSVWALSAVEVGVFGLAALAWLVVGGLLAAGRRGSLALAALVGGTAVMSLDVFASMPLQSLSWWAIIGLAWGPPEASARGAGWRRHVANAVLIVSVAFALVAGARFWFPCGDDCDPLRRYAGHPRFTGVLTDPVALDAADERWSRWLSYYPLAFWLRQAQTEASAPSEPTAQLELLRAFPYQSSGSYLKVADSFEGTALAADVAACGLVRMFGDAPIWRDWRSSAEELHLHRKELERRSVAVEVTEAACERAGIPVEPLGMQVGHAR